MAKETIEKIWEEALLMLEAGKPRADVWRAFPQHEKEIAELFHILALLESERRNVTPPREALAKILEKLPEEGEFKSGQVAVSSLRLGLRDAARRLTRPLVFPVGIAVVLLFIFFAGRQGAEPMDNGFLSGKRSGMREGISVIEQAPMISDGVKGGAAGAETELRMSVPASAPLSAPSGFGDTESIGAYAFPPARGNIGEIMSVLEEGESANQAFSERDASFIFSEDKGLSVFEEPLYEEGF